MRKGLCRALTLTGAFLCAGLTATSASAGGFYVPELNARTLSVSGAVVASNRNAGSAFMNPATLAASSELGGTRTQLQLSGNIFLPRISYFRRPFVDPHTDNEVRFSEVNNENRIGGTPFFGVASDLGASDSKWSAGLSVSVPFGAALEYPQDGAQAFQVQKVALTTIFVSPALAYRISKGFSVGFGLNYVYSAFHLEQANALPHVTNDPETVPNPPADVVGQTVLEAKDQAAYSVNLGLHFREPDKNRFAFGVSVLTPTTLAMEGKAEIENDGITKLTDENYEELQGDDLRTDDISLEMKLPLIVRVAGEVQVHPRVRFMAQFDWQQWSSTKRLEIDFKNEWELAPIPNGELVDVVLEQKWKDSYSLRLASEFRLLKTKPLVGRLGALVDSSPIPDRSFDLLAPDSDKLGVSVGLGYRFKPKKGVELGADVGYMHLFLKERSIGPDAEGAPGTDRTILNKPAPSFYQGVTRVAFDILSIALSVGL